MAKPPGHPISGADSRPRLYLRQVRVDGVVHGSWRKSVNGTPKTTLTMPLAFAEGLHAVGGGECVIIVEEPERAL